MNRTSVQRRARRLAACLACGAFASFNASAQLPDEQQPPQPPPEATPVPPEAAPIEEQQMDRFADAYVLIEEIHTQAVAELEATQDPDQATAIRQKAEGKIIEAVERSGLRLDEFNRIAEQMTVDAALRTKIADKVAERRRI